MNTPKTEFRAVVNGRTVYRIQAHDAQVAERVIASAMRHRGQADYAIVTDEPLSPELAHRTSPAPTPTGSEIERRAKIERDAYLGPAEIRRRCRLGMTIPPHTRAVYRQRDRLRHERRCRRCGQSDVIDGIVFSVDPSRQLCDDCYG